MNTSSGKRNEPIISKASKRNMRKKLVRYAKKAKVEELADITIDEESTATLNPHNEKTEIFYDPDKVS